MGENEREITWLWGMNIKKKGKNSFPPRMRYFRSQLPLITLDSFPVKVHMN